MDRWILFYYVNLRRNNLSNRKEDGEELLLLLRTRTRRNGRSFLFLRGCLWIPTLWGVQSICAIVRGEVDPTALLFAAQSVSPSLSVHSRMDPFNLSASINSFHGRRYQYLSYRNVLLLHHRIIHPSRKGAADPQLIVVVSLLWVTFSCEIRWTRIALAWLRLLRLLSILQNNALHCPCSREAITVQWTIL